MGRMTVYCKIGYFPSPGVAETYKHPLVYLQVYFQPWGAPRFYQAAMLIIYYDFIPFELPDSARMPSVNYFGPGRVKI